MGVHDFHSMALGGAFLAELLLAKRIIVEPQKERRFAKLLDSTPYSAGLLKNIFDKRELKKRKKRIQQIMNGEMIGKATREAIETMEAAVMISVIIPAVVASTTTTH